MPKKYLKFLNRLPKDFRIKLAEVLLRIETLDLEDLDIKKMKGNENKFRCRVGKFRIIFLKTQKRGNIIEINTRGNIY